MKAIILAAGLGQRLHPHTIDKPKAMVELMGCSLIQRQIDIYEYFGVSPVIIVGGHGFSTLKKTGCTLVKNENFSTTNMVYSLLCARNHLDDDVIVSYGDIIYEPCILEKLIKSSHNISVAVDTNWRSYWEARFENPLCDAETLKISSDQKLLEIGNKPHSYADIDAQFMGLIKFKKSSLSNILHLCDTLNASSNKLSAELNGTTIESAYTTDLLNHLINEKVSIYAVKFSGAWVEIDTTTDLGNEVTVQRCKKIDEAICELR